MKRNISYALFAVCMVLTFIVSCGPMEPATYTENFYRIATVKYDEGKASLLFDYTGENYNIENFKTKADMEYFDLHNGDRIVASLQYYAVSTVGQITLQSAIRYPILNLAETRPADTLNHDYRFNVLNLWDQQYPAIWAQGHLVNLAPVYYVPSNNSVANFYLYPLQMNKDTLEMRLYSYIPDNDLSLHGYSSASQSWLCYDIASLRDSVADPDEFSHRQKLLKGIQKLNRDSFMVHIFAPDTLCGMIDTIYYEFYPRVSVSIKVPFDF